MMILLAYIFPKLGGRETCLDKYLKNRASEHPSTVDILNGPKYHLSLHDSTFAIFFHHS